MIQYASKKHGNFVFCRVVIRLNKREVEVLQLLKEVGTERVRTNLNKFVKERSRLISFLELAHFVL